MIIMETKTKKNLIIWGVVLLVLLNVTSLGTIWYHRYQFKNERAKRENVARENGRRMQQPREPRQGVPPFLIKNLELTDEQMKMFTSIWDIHSVERRSLEDKMNENRVAMGELLSKAELDSTTFLQTSAEQVRLMQDLDYTMLKMNLEIREILSKEQLNEFLSRLDQLNKRMRNRPNRPQKNNK